MPTGAALLARAVALQKDFEQAERNPGFFELLMFGYVAVTRVAFSDPMFTV